MNCPSAKLVQDCVLIYITYSFARRGRENLCDMSIDKFEVQTDLDRTQFIVQVKDEIDKNDGINVTEPAKQGRMYEIPGKFHAMSSKVIFFIILNMKKSFY